MPEDKPTTKAEPAVQIALELVLADSKTFARMLSISPRHFAALESSGAVGPMPIRLGQSRRKLFSVSEIREWCQNGSKSRIEWQTIRGMGNE